MQWIKIDEVLFFQEGPGVRNTQYTSAGVKLLNVANLVDGKVDLSTSDRYISEEEAYGKYKHFLCDEGDFIVASSGIKVEYIDKKMGFIEKSMLPLCMNTSTIRFKVKNPDILRIRYFMYYLKSQHFKSQLARYITGSAQLNYGPSHLKKMVMPLASIEKQDEIVEKLDCLQNAINIREQQLAKLDDLVKSRFIELFGMPGTDAFGWGLVPLGSICNINPKKSLDSRLVSGAVVSFVPMPAVTEHGEIDATAIKEYDEVKTGFTYFAENDVLFAKITPCMENGKGAVAKGLHNGIGFGSTEFHVLRPISGKSDPYWIYTLTAFSQFRMDAASNMTGSAGQRRVPASFLENYRVSLPPIALQEQFAAFVEQTDKSKLAVKQSLEKLETLKKSLMQQYFGV